MTDITDPLVAAFERLAHEQERTANALVRIANLLDGYLTRRT